MFFFVPLEWILNLEAGLHSLKYLVLHSSITKITKKIHNFGFQFLHVGGCAGYPLSSKSILKVNKQMSIPKEYVHIPSLTPWIDFVGILGFQSMELRYQTPCSSSVHSPNLVR